MRATYHIHLMILNVFILIIFSG